MVKLRGTCIAPVTGTLKRDDVYEWVKPTYRLSKEEKQHARQVIAEYKKENPGYVKYTDAIKTKTGGGYLKTIPEETLAEYRRMDLLQAKMDNLTIVAAGAAGTIEIPAAQLGHLGERIGVGAGEKMASLLPWTDREKLSKGSSQLNAGADQYLNGILQYHYGMHNQNPAAYNAGAIAANVGEMYVCNRVTDQISGVAENGATGAYQGELNARNPQLYLDRALKNQGLDSTPAKMKEVWAEGNYKYTVRIHEGNSVHTDADFIYRVSRQNSIIDSNGQGTGLEYLGTDGNWYHESILKEFNRGGISNPSFNENAARLTHIPVGGKQ